MSDNNIPHIKSVETRYLEQREALFRGLQRFEPARIPHGLRRRGRGRRLPQASVSPFTASCRSTWAYADAVDRPQGFTFAYISDSHLYAKKTNERLRAPAACARGG